VKVTHLINVPATKLAPDIKLSRDLIDSLVVVDGPMRRDQETRLWLLTIDRDLELAIDGLWYSQSCALARSLICDVADLDRRSI
jgi:hypothetical protein